MTAVAAAGQAIVVTAHRKGELVKPGWGGAAGSGPTSAYLSRSLWRINFPRKKIFGVRLRRVTRCEASGKGFDGQVGRMAEEARRSAGEAARAVGTKADQTARAVGTKADQVFDGVKRKVVDFQERTDFPGKVWMTILHTIYAADCIFSCRH